MRAKIWRLCEGKKWDRYCDCCRPALVPLLHWRNWSICRRLSSNTRPSAVCRVTASYTTRAILIIPSECRHIADRASKSKWPLVRCWNAGNSSGTNERIQGNARPSSSFWPLRIGFCNSGGKLPLAESCPLKTFSIVLSSPIDTKWQMPSSSHNNKCCSLRKPRNVCANQIEGPSSLVFSAVVFVVEPFR